MMSKHKRREKHMKYDEKEKRDLQFIELGFYK